VIAQRPLGRHPRAPGASAAARRRASPLDASAARPCPNYELGARSHPHPNSIALCQPPSHTHTQVLSVCRPARTGLQAPRLHALRDRGAHAALDRQDERRVFSKKAPKRSAKHTPAASRERSHRKTGRPPCSRDKPPSKSIKRPAQLQVVHGCMPVCLHDSALLHEQKQLERRGRPAGGSSAYRGDRKYSKMGGAVRRELRR
jgi:hypothetical protein